MAAVWASHPAQGMWGFLSHSVMPVTQHSAGSWGSHLPPLHGPTALPCSHREGWPMGIGNSCFSRQEEAHAWGRERESEGALWPRVPEALWLQSDYGITVPFGMCFQNKPSDQPLAPSLSCCAGSLSPQDCALPSLNAAGDRSYPPKHNPCVWPPKQLPAAAHAGTAMALPLYFSGNNSNRDTHTTQQSHLFCFLFFFLQDTVILAGVLPKKNIHFTFITLVYYLRALSLNSRVDTLLLK